MTETTLVHHVRFEAERGALEEIGPSIEARMREVEGCLRFAFHRGLVDPNAVLLEQEWTSQRAFEAYKSSPAFAENRAALGPAILGPPASVTRILLERRAG